MEKFHAAAFAIGESWHPVPEQALLRFVMAEQGTVVHSDIIESAIAVLLCDYRFHDLHPDSVRNSQKLAFSTGKAGQGF